MKGSYRKIFRKATSTTVLVAFFSASIFPQYTPASAALAELDSLAELPYCPEVSTESGELTTSAESEIQRCRPIGIVKPPPCKTGTIDGSSGVTCTGAGTYEIPIDVPPGSADMQPALSLNYNSQAGNGLVGMGWSINGLSSITRCAANMVFDGYKGGINYDADDKFCLDGQRLIPIAPVGGAVQKYRTEPDTFTRVISYGTTTTGADYFTAEAKSGLITEYGKTANSKIYAQGSTEVRVWAASKLINRVGSYVEYFYNNDALTAVNGEYSPRAIQYTGNDNTIPVTTPYNYVRFQYRNRPPDDVAPFYQGGSVIKVTKLLDTITTCLSSDCVGTVVTQHRLQYQQNNGTRRSQLSSVQMCDRNNICLPATTMTWSDQGVTNLAGNRTSGNYGTGGNVGRQWNSGINGFAGADSTFMRSNAPIYQDALATSVKGIANAPDVESVVINSLNLIMGIASLYFDPIGGIVGRILGLLKQWFTSDYWIAKGKVGDVNGDGRTDIVGLEKKNGDVDDDYVWLSKRLFSGKNEFIPQDTAPIWKTKNMFQFSNEATESDEAKLADFNGDGLMDVLSYEEKNATTPSDAYVYLSNGVNNFDYHGMFRKAVGPNERKAIGHSALGDFNGDGRADFAQFTVENNIFKDDVYGHINLAQGNTFTEMTDWGRVCETFGIDCKRGDHPLEDVLLGDVNGDGKHDIVVFKEVDDGSGSGSKDTHAYIYLTNKYANGWVAGSPVDFNFTYNLNRRDDNATVILPGDFNGDGKMDLVLFAPNTIYKDSSNDTNNSGTEDNGDVRMYNSSFELYLSTGRTFIKKYSSFDSGYGEYFKGQNAPFAIGPRKPIDPDGYIQYAEGSDLWFLARLGDFNGDGKTDIIIFDSNNNHNAHLWLSDGTLLRPEINWGSDFGFIDEDTLGDFDGDGRADVLQFAHGNYPGHPGDSDHYDGQLNVTLSSSYPFPDLMTRVTDGFGKKVEFDYKPITNDDVYKGHTTFAGVDSEVYNFRGPLYVVSEHRTSNGIGGMYKQQYTYYGSKSHRSHGFLGFSKIVIHDPQTFTTETNEYEQIYPLICKNKSKLTSQPIEAAADKVSQTSNLSRHTMTWNVLNGTGMGGTPHVVQLDAETDVQYELDGSTISNTRIAYEDYDLFGNIKRQVTSWPDVLLDVETVTNTFYNNDTSWILGLPESTSVTRSQPVVVPAKVVNRVFDTTKRLLTSSTEVLQGGKTLTTSYPIEDYDAFGNPKKVVVSGTGIIPSRTTNIDYDSKGRFPTSIQNPLGETTNMTFGDEFGQIKSITDPNVLTTTWLYDGFGRQIRETRPDATISQTNYCPSTEGGYKPQYGVHWVQNRTSGQPNQTMFYDERGRNVRDVIVGFNGARILRDSIYDTALRLNQISMPYFYGTLSSLTRLNYDVRNRVIKELAPNGAQTTYSYNGNVALGPHPFSPDLSSRLLWHQVTAQNDLGQKTEYIVNRINQVNQIAHRDPSGILLSHMTYNYDGFNNPIGVADENNNITTRVFENDRVVSLSDPDMGSSTYTYDVLGNLKSMSDANTNTFSFTYDLLDRLVSRTELEGTSTWTYGTSAVDKNIGRLTQTLDDSTGFVENYEYDGFSRPFKTYTTIPPASFITERSYDLLGRVATLKYPGSDGFTVRYDYNPYGYLSAVSNNATNALIWQTNSLNAAGQLTAQTHGNTNPGNNTLRSAFTYDTMLNIKDIKIGDKIGSLFLLNPLKRLTFTYNSINNLTEQRNLIRTSVDNRDYIDWFNYDALNRLTRLFNAEEDHILQIGIPREEVTYDFNAIGNIMHKSDLSVNPNYIYPISGQPHAAKTVCDDPTGCHDFEYDLNGNMITGEDFQNPGIRTVDWYSFNKPLRLGGLGKLLSLTYDSYRDKIKQVSVTSGHIKTTEYVGGLLEKAMDTMTGITEHKYYIYGSDANPVAMYTTRSTGLNDVRYFHYDNFGSLTLITDENAGIVEDLSFDAFGVRRNPDWTSGNVASLSAHGYTFHEHLDEFGLIDMKGRMYDPKIGRFLSTDPYNTEPFMTENLNRYSYVHNSPTNFIDPSGFQLKGGACYNFGCGGGGGGGGIGGAIAFGVISGIGQAALSDASSSQYTYQWAPASTDPRATIPPAYQYQALLGTNFMGPGPDGPLANPFRLPDPNHPGKFLTPVDAIDKAAQLHDYYYWQAGTGGVRGALFNLQVLFADLKLTRDAYNIMKQYEARGIDEVTGAQISLKTYFRAQVVYEIFSRTSTNKLARLLNLNANQKALPDYSSPSIAMPVSTYVRPAVIRPQPIPYRLRLPVGY